MAGRVAPVLSLTSSVWLAVLLGHVAGLGPAVSPAHMKMGPFEPSLRSHLPDSMVLAELTTTSVCACQQACLVRHDCLSASTSKKMLKQAATRVEEEPNEHLTNREDSDPSNEARAGDIPKSVKEIVSDELTCRLGRRRGHPDINLVDSASQFWERFGRSRLGDYCAQSSECLTAGAVCHESTCLCAAGLRADGSCHCPAGVSGECWFQTCAEVRGAGVSDSGVYWLRHRASDDQQQRVSQVRCEMTKDNHGWTVIQSRDLAIDDGGTFNRSWQEYLTMFGSVNNNYWLGLRLIREIIKIGGGKQILRIVLQDDGGKRDYASYDGFQLTPENEKFALTVGDQRPNEGSLGPEMTYLSGLRFSTYDDFYYGEPQNNCAQKLGGGWWYMSNICRTISSLNGDAIEWLGWRQRTIVKSLMMVRSNDE